MRSDTSGYSKEDARPLPIGLIKKVIGLIKDKLGEKIMTEFVALRPKLCSYKFDAKEDKKCKGMWLRRISNLMTMSIAFLVVLMLTDCN